MQTPSTSARLLAAAFVLCCLVLVPGCPGAGDVNNSVNGKVTVGDKPASGSVVFLGPDNKEVMGAISPDGTYNIPNPKKGLNKIAVKGTGMPALVQSGGKMPGIKEKDVPEQKDKMPDVGGGVDPPKKYESFESSGLTYEVKGSGKEPFDIKLEKK
jgi:hypothetical protein